MRKIKIFLSDPQVLFREGIHFVLSGEDDFEVTGEAVSNEDALCHIKDNPPHIAILSMHNGKLTGPEVTRHIKRHCPSVSVILVMDTSDEEQLFLAMKSGASVCLTKYTNPEQLLDIIRDVIKGSQPIIEALLIPGLASRVLTEFQDIATLNEQLDNLLANLTPKETEVLGSIAAGDNMEQVTTKLDTDEESIKQYLRLILNKLIANDQAKAVIEADQRSLPSMIRGAVRAGGPSVEYVTKKEFSEFKESLAERLKNFIGKTV
jgi:DNA-binding NarL/FixJ family response regulator